MKNDILELKCIDMSIDGQGICKKDGFVIFVKGMILDEVAKVKIIAGKKNMAFGIIDELISPSPYRIKSLCPVSYKCGGCDYRYIDYNYQLLLKKRLLEQTFKNFKLDVAIDDVVASDDPLYYRNKTQIPVNESKYGFYRKFSNDIVEFDECFIQTKLTNDILKDLKEIIHTYHQDSNLRHVVIKHAQGTGEVMLAFVCYKKEDITNIVDDITEKYKNIKSVILNVNDKDTNVILGNKEYLLYGRNYIIDEFEGLKFRISLKSFYQVNYNQMIKLYNLITTKASFTKEDRVLDLFSGIGTISLFVSNKVKEVTGIEIVREAVNNANDNKQLNNIDNAKFVLADASKELNDYIKDKDVVIVDPPRKGLSENLINSLVNLEVKKIIYVSCNPATLARDLTLFKDKYTFSTITPVDMFPYTTHVECVVLLAKKK